MVTRSLLQVALLVGLLGAAGPASATVAVTPPAGAPASAGDRSAVPASPGNQPAVTQVVPLSAADAATARTQAFPDSDFVQPDLALTPFHRFTRTPVLGRLTLVEVAAIGGILIGLTSYARRRHRRRIGWAFLPTRSARRLHPDG